MHETTQPTPPENSTITQLEVFLVCSYQKKRQNYKPANATLKKRLFNSIATRGPNFEPIYLFLRPDFYFRQELVSEGYDIRVLYRLSEVNLLDSALFDHEIKGLRFGFDFSGLEFGVKSADNLPKLQMLTLCRQGLWREVPLKSDPPTHNVFWNTFGKAIMQSWKQGRNVLEIETTKQHFRVIWDGQMVCQIDNFQTIFAPNSMRFYVSSWLAGVNEYFTLGKPYKLPELFQLYYTTELLSRQPSSLGEFIGTQFHTFRADLQIECPLELRVVKPLSDMFGGMATAYGHGKESSAITEIRLECLELTRLISSMEGKKLNDDLLKRVELMIPKLRGQFDGYFQWSFSVHSLTDMITKRLEEIDPNFTAYQHLVILLSNPSIKWFAHHFFGMIDREDAEVAFPERTSYQFGNYDMSVRENHLECKTQRQVTTAYQISLPDFITKDGPCQVVVLPFNHHHILVENSKLRRKVFVLVDIALAIESLSNTTCNPKRAFYKRVLSPVVKTDILCQQEKELEPPAVFRSKRSITVLHKECMGSGGTHANIHCVRKLVLSYNRPTVHGRRRNWLQLDLKNIHTHRWAYWIKALPPAILSHDRNRQIFVATGQTLYGEPTEVQQRKEIAELECYSVDWTARTIKLSVKSAVAINTSGYRENLQEWRLVRGIVFYMFFQRTPRLVWLYCFHRGAFVPAGKQTTVAQPMDLGSLGVEELHFVTDGPVQGYAVGRQVKGETADGHMVHRFFRIQPTF